MQRRSLHSLLELAGREVKSKAVSERGEAVRSRGRWVMLPPVPTITANSKSLLHIMQQPKHVSAIAWLKQCCPQISQNDAETLFRSCQVKICDAASQTNDLEHAELRRVDRKKILPEGSVLFLPRRSLESLNVRCRGRRLNSVTESSPSTSDKDSLSECEEERQSQCDEDAA